MVKYEEFKLFNEKRNQKIRKSGNQEKFNKFRKQKQSPIQTLEKDGKTIGNLRFKVKCLQYMNIHF